MAGIYRHGKSSEPGQIFKDDNSMCAALAEGVGFEPTRERKPPGGFQDRCLKPLGHPSKSLSVKIHDIYAAS